MTIFQNNFYFQKCRFTLLHSCALTHDYADLHLNQLYENTNAYPEMEMVAFGTFLVDFRAQWQKVVGDKINSLLSRQSKHKVYNSEPLTMQSIGIDFLFILLRSLYCSFLDTIDR